MQERQLAWGGIRPFIKPLLGLSLLSLLLYAIESVRAGTGRDWYLAWNLFLAWMPLLAAAAWAQVLRWVPRWTDWRSLLPLAAWLVFLPNSFYIVTDFIHLYGPHHTDLLVAAVMFFGFALTGFALGLLSLGVVHRELRRNVGARLTAAVLASVVLLASFAIYLGRDLRWNSWDVVFNPAGILFDVSDRLVDPGSHPQALVITVLFFILIGGTYLVALGTVRAVRSLPPPKK